MVEGETHGELVVKVRSRLASQEGEEEGQLSPHEAIEQGAELTKDALRVIASTAPAPIAQSEVVKALTGMGYKATDATKDALIERARQRRGADRWQGREDGPRDEPLGGVPDERHAGRPSGPADAEGMSAPVRAGDRRGHACRRLPVACLSRRPSSAIPPSAHTVVLLLRARNDEGGSGVVLNRPSDHPGRRGAPRLGRSVVAQPEVVFFGGPVGFDSGGGARRYDDEEQGGPSFRPIVGSVGTVDLNLPPDPATPPRVVRLFAGSAGWGGGQLEEEIAEGSWFVVDARRGRHRHGGP